MYNQTYEEYMRNVLGYMPTYQDMEYPTYRNDTNINYPMMPSNDIAAYQECAEVEAMYPDIYKIVYPMVKKACGNNQREITEENVEAITMEIFTNVEASMETQTSITVQNRNKEGKTGVKVEENRNRPENRNRNFLLKDLIRILVLRELLGGNRPILPRPRPPFPGGPIGPGPRPPFPGRPIQPRNYDQDGMFY